MLDKYYKYRNKTHTILWVISLFNVFWNRCLGWSVIYEKILKIQKDILMIMTLSPPRKSCKQIFENLNILTAPSMYCYL